MDKDLSKIKTPGQRCRYFRKQIKEHTLEQAASKIGCSPQTLSKFENDRHSNGTSFIFKIARYCQVTPEFLLGGKDPYQVQIVYGGKLRVISDKRKSPLLAHYVTPITWEEAAKDINIADDVADREKREARDPIPRPNNASFQCIALRMKGNSMASKGGALSFLDGDVLIFDPERKPKNGDFVLARIHNEKIAIFRQYVDDCGVIQLAPLNPSWPSIKLDNNKILIHSVLVERKTFF